MVTFEITIYEEWKDDLNDPLTGYFIALSELYIQYFTPKLNITTVTGADEIKFLSCKVNKFTLISERRRATSEGEDSNIIAEFESVYNILTDSGLSSSGLTNDAEESIAKDLIYQVTTNVNNGIDSNSLITMKELDKISSAFVNVLIETTDLPMSASQDTFEIKILTTKDSTLAPTTDSTFEPTTKSTFVQATDSTFMLITDSTLMPTTESTYNTAIDKTTTGDIATSTIDGTTDAEFDTTTLDRITTDGVATTTTNVTTTREVTATADKITPGEITTTVIDRTTTGEAASTTTDQATTGQITLTTDITKTGEVFMTTPDKITTGDIATITTYESTTGQITSTSHGNELFETKIVVSFEITIYEQWTDDLTDHTSDYFIALSELYVQYLLPMVNITSVSGADEIKFSTCRVNKFLLGSRRRRATSDGEESNIIADFETLYDVLVETESSSSGLTDDAEESISQDLINQVTTNVNSIIEEFDIGTDSHIIGDTHFLTYIEKISFAFGKVLIEATDSIPSTEAATSAAKTTTMMISETTESITKTKTSVEPIVSTESSTQAGIGTTQDITSPILPIEAITELVTSVQSSTEIEITTAKATTVSITAPETSTQFSIESTIEITTGITITTTTEDKTLPETTTNDPTEQITSSKSTTEDLQTEQTTQHSIITTEETTITSTRTTTEPMSDIATTLTDVITRIFCPYTIGNLSGKLITNETHNHDLFQYSYTNSFSFVVENFLIIYSGYNDARCDNQTHHRGFYIRDDNDFHCCSMG